MILSRKFERLSTRMMGRAIESCNVPVVHFAWGARSWPEAVSTMPSGAVRCLPAGSAGQSGRPSRLLQQPGGCGCVLGSVAPGFLQDFRASMHEDHFVVPLVKPIAADGVRIWGPWA